MKYFAESVFQHIRKQIDQAGDGAGSGNRLMFMMPGLPADVVLRMGKRLASYCADRSSLSMPLIKISAPLVAEWQDASDPRVRETADEIRANGWCDDDGTLTSYRHQMPEGNAKLVVLLIGVDRVTDASSLEDFHQCDFRTIWDEELQSSFDPWIRAKLDEASIGYEAETVTHFNWVLRPVVERGLADVLQISSLLQELDLREAQDGRDAERVLLTSLGRFGLPQFGNFRFTTPKALGAYLDQALAFFSYDAFMEAPARKKALQAVERFVKHNPPGEVFAPDERQAFASDEEFLDGLREYIASGNREVRDRLSRCDFPTIRDRVLGFREPKDPDDDRPKKPTVRKLSGGPIEMVLSALWTTLREFKRVADKHDIFAHETLDRIEIRSHTFCDGESPEQRKQNAIRYLARLLGGVDQFVEHWIDMSRFCAEGRNASVKSQLVHPDVVFQPARTAEPCLQFSITIRGEGLNRPVVGQWAICLASAGDPTVPGHG